ncbi:hypothetical protein SBBP2_1530002 [Burkholderiales bacterium]|nr:hypothetical protein SBBP2_1530002 [Burkholderiales bacterium]
MNTGVLGQELSDPLGLVRREVVGDHMDLLAPWAGWSRYR